MDSEEKMLADKMVELNYVEQVSTKTIRQILRQTLNRHCLNRRLPDLKILYTTNN